jgi:hypothetical protein
MTCINYCLTVTVLFPWGALSERTGLSFVCAAGPCQRSLSRVRVPWDLRPYFTVSDLRLPFSSTPTTRRVTAEQSRAVAYCRQPASTVTPGFEPRWDPWPYIYSVSRLLFFSSFVVPPLVKREGLGFSIIDVPLLHLIPPEVTLK